MLAAGFWAMLVSMIRILVVDDQPTVRQGLRMRLALETDCLVVGEAGTGSAALQLVRSVKPDVILMDVEMPDMDGVEAAEKVRAIAPDSAVVILTIHDDAATRARASTTGVAAFVGKHDPTEQLLEAIRQAA
jgi:DNA-binding NarL/FixJ family response regulator